MKKVSYKTVSTRALRDAAMVCVGLYSMNAGGSRFYAFNCNEKEVTNGEFCWDSEIDRMKSRYDFCIDKWELVGRNLSAFRKALRVTSDIV